MSKSTTGRARWLFAACKAKTDHAMSKLVLIALADRAGDDGLAYPTLDRLAEDCECSRSTVIRCLARLEAGGFIEKAAQFSKGLQRENYYRISENVQFLGVQNRGVSERHPGVSERNPGGVTETQKGCQRDTPGVSQRHPEPPIEPPIEPPNINTQSASAPDDRLAPCLDADSPAATFDDFISEYPVQSHHVPALRAWLALAPDRELADQIIEHVRQRVACGAWDTSPAGLKYLPNPANFIRDKRWRDQFTAAADTQRPRTLAERNAQVIAEWRAGQGERSGSESAADVLMGGQIIDQ